MYEGKAANEINPKPSDPYAVLHLASTCLKNHYAENQSQARVSFCRAVSVMVCGLTILGAVWIYLVTRHVADAFPISVATAAGLAVTAISVLFLHRHNRTQRRSSYCLAQLVRIQQLELALSLAESVDKEPAEGNARTKVIEEVLATLKSTAERDAVLASREAG